MVSKKKQSEYQVSELPPIGFVNARMLAENQVGDI